MLRGFLRKVGIVALILGIVLGVVGREAYMIIFDEPTDIYEEVLEDPAEIKAGMAIETDIFMLLDCFGTSQVEYKNRSGSTYSTSSYDYYILPIFVGEDDTYYVAFEVSNRNDDRKTYEKIMEETYRYLSGEASSFGEDYVHLYGGLETLKDEMYDYMVEWFEEVEWFESEEELKEHVLPLYLSKVSKSNMTTTFYVNIALLIAGALFLILSFLVGGKDAARKKELKKLAKGKKITFGGRSYDLDKLDVVDQNIWKGYTQVAKNDLMRVYGATEEEADYAIANWNLLTRGM